MNNNNDCWILTLNFLFEREVSLINQKDKQIDKIFNDDTECIGRDELEVFTENLDSQVEEICDLIEHVYKYKHKKEALWGNYISTTEDK